MTSLPPPPTAARHSAPEGPKSPIWRRGWVLGLTGLLVGLVAGIGIGSQSDDDNAADPKTASITTTEEAASSNTTATEATTTTVPAITTSVAPTTTQAPEPDGSERDKPLPAGTAVEVEGISNTVWRVRVVENQGNVTDVVANANQFNDPPAANMQFFGLRLEFTKVSGSEPESPLFEIDLGVVGSENKVRDDDCGVIEDEIYDLSDMFNGASEQANACFEVANSEVDSLVLQIGSGWGDGYTYVAL